MCYIGSLILIDEHQREIGDLVKTIFQQEQDLSMTRLRHENVGMTFQPDEALPDFVERCVEPDDLYRLVAIDQHITIYKYAIGSKRNRCVRPAVSIKYGNLKPPPLRHL